MMGLEGVIEGMVIMGKARGCGGAVEGKVAA